MKGARIFFATLVLSLSFGLLPAAAQSLPVQVTVQGNTATAVIGNPLSPAADVTLQFEDATGLSASSLGLSARLVDVTDPAILARLPDPTQNLLPAAQPLLVTIAPPATGGLSLRGVVRFELHTHALPYALGSSFRVFKAPPGGNFRDITHEIAQGSVRARGTTSGFSQFLVLTDLRATDAVCSTRSPSCMPPWPRCRPPSARRSRRCSPRWKARWRAATTMAPSRWPSNWRSVPGRAPRRARSATNGAPRGTCRTRPATWSPARSR